MREAMRTAILLALLGGLACQTATAAGSAAAGKEKAAPCMACHGLDGKGTAPIYPNLAGQQPAYLEGALHAYKNGDRSAGQAGIMNAYTSDLSDQDIADLAAYYSAQKP